MLNGNWYHFVTLKTDIFFILKAYFSKRIISNQSATANLWAFAKKEKK